MDIFLNFLILLAGLVLVIKGADFLVDGSSAVAKRFNIPEIVIGLTIVSMGTSAPELIVNVFSSIQGKSEIVLGNIIGSNIANSMLILGASALIFPLIVKRNTVIKEMPFNIISVMMLFIFANIAIFGRGDNIISRLESAILVVCFCAFLFYVYKLSLLGSQDEIGVKKMHIAVSLLFVIGGIAALVIGGKFTVDSAVNLAKIMGVSEKLIALTIISIGTSLPELATSVVAALKKRSDIAIGNVIGSNIFNIFFVLGVSGLIRPIAFQPTFNIDLIILFIVSLLIFLFMFTGKKFCMGRFKGSILFFGYIIYILYLVLHETGLI